MEYSIDRTKKEGCAKPRRLLRCQKRSVARTDMISVKVPSLRLNRVLLLAVGLWPYQQSRLARLQLILLYSILVTFIVFQFTTFATAKCTPQLIVEVLAGSCLFILMTIKYSMFSFNMNAVRHLLEVLQHIYNELRDDSEVAIIQEYGNIGKRYTELFTLLVMLGSAITFILFWPYLHDIALAVNDSRSQFPVPIRTEYFIDKDKYFFLTVLHAGVASFVGMIVVLATGTLLMAYFQYTCGMFKVASYRMERAVSINTLKASSKGNDLISKEIISAVDIHRNAIEYVELLMSKLSLLYFFLAIITIISLSINLLRIYQELSSGFNAEKMIFPFTFLSAQYFYLYFAHGCAQQITDHCNNFFATVYNVRWYAAPLHIQKITLFLLQRGTKAFTVTAGGFIVGSLENAASMTSVSISYFTVLYSTRQL